MNTFCLLFLPFFLALLSCGRCDADPLKDGERLLKEGRFSQAEAIFTKEMQKARTGGQRHREALSLKYRGSARYLSGDIENALLLYGKAAAIFKALGRDLERADVLNNISLIHERQGDLERALKIQGQCLEIYARYTHKTGLASSHANLAAIHRRLGDRASGTLSEAAYSAALSHLKEAQKQLEGYADEDRRILAEVLLNRGNLYVSLGSVKESASLYRKAAEAFRDLGLPLGEAKAQANLGMVLRQLGHFGEAFEAVSSSLGFMERLRGKLVCESLRVAFAEDKIFLYELAVELLFRTGRLEKAFEYSERARSRAFLDLLGSRSLGGEKQRSPEAKRLVEREQSLLRRLEALSENVDGTDYLDTLREYESLLERIAAMDPEYASLKSVQPASTKEIRALLGPDEALVEYFLGHKALYAFVLKKEVLTGRQLDMAPEGVNALSTAIENEIASPAWYRHRKQTSWQDTLHKAYRSLFQPLEESLGGTGKVILVPHGCLHSLPFAALVTKRDEDALQKGETPRPRFLVEKYAFSVLPSAGVLPYLRKKNPGGFSSALIFADALYPAGWPRLPRTALEARAIRKLLPACKVYSGQAATETRFFREGPLSGILHLATHGELNALDPLSSRILLSPDEENDGSLTVPEIFNMALNAYLVTLNACQTGLSAARTSMERHFAKGDDLVGLSRAFLYAGAPSLIATLWRVSDEASKRLMIDFYKHLKKDDKAEALRRAQLTLMHKTYDGEPLHHPSLWAGHVLIGDRR